MTTTIEERVEAFTKELTKKVRHMAGEGQYTEEPERRSAYLDGVETALAMMYIDLTGTPKTKGMLHTALTTIAQEERERILRKINSKTAPNQPDPYVSEFEEGYDRALYDTMEMIKALTQ